MFTSTKLDKRNSNVPFVNSGRGDESPTFVRAAHKSVFLNDIAIQPSKEAPLEPKSSFSKREKWMIAGLILLLILCLIFIVLFVTSEKKAESQQQKRFCESPTCISLASGMLTAMNRSVDPCVDFFEYACGTWIKNSIIPEGKSSWSQFQVLYERNEEVMKRLISDDSARRTYADNEAIMKGFAMFDSCMNLSVINQRGATPLLELMKLYGSWNVTDGNWTESSWNFMDTFVDIQKNLSIAPLFNMFVSVDLKDSTKNIIVLDQSGLGISRESYLKNTSYHKKVRRAYKTLMFDLVELLADGRDTKALMMEIYDFEESLAKLFIPREKRRDPNQIYKKMTLNQFIKSSGIAIDLMEFLKKMFKETGYNITGDEMIVSYATDYFRSMSAVYSNTSKRVIANYMMWRVVLRFAYSLTEEFKQVYYNYQKTVRGSTGKQDRWQDCLGVVDGSFGMPFGLMFVDKTFTGRSKESAEDMIHDIRQVFLANLEELDWMDEETKERAREKANAIRENIGYPNYLKNNTALALMYKGLDIEKTKYFENIVNSYTFSNMKNYAKLGKPVDKKRWSMTPSTVNAYYSATDNKIVFPAGILQSPFYDNRFPKALNYGGIGMVVGHEITHGFDDNGRLFNKDGNLAKWWTNASIVAFKKKTKCLVDQYSNYTFHDEPLKGVQTLGENIADNGGIKQAFQAYQNWKRSSRGGEEPALPGLKEFSNEQIFFLGFAQIWCSKYLKPAAIRQVDNGVHSPGKWRVIGSLSNFDEFAKAYKCPRGSPMNPVKKCSVW